MLSLVTLGVRDLAASRRFYTEGLGAAVVLDLPEVVFVQAAHGVLLSLFGVDDLQADAGSDEPAGDPARAPVVFAHNVPDEPAVDAAVERAVAAGGRVLQRARRASWGGWYAHVSDPDGFRWEIAHNPGLRVAADGSVTIGTVRDR